LLCLESSPAIAVLNTQSVYRAFGSVFQESKGSDPGYLQEVTSASGKEAAEDLIKAGQGLLNLLNEVIEFSKYESGDLPVYEIKFNLRALVDDIIALVMPSAQEKKLKLELTCDSRIPVYLIGDATRLQRILLNLVTNAIKFTSHGAVNLRIQLVQLRRQRIVIQCQVADTGIGIPPDKQGLIFMRFERLHPSFRGQYAGSGLGLALVKQFISELDGEIYVESKENKGSLFTCLIPLRIALSPGPEQTTRPSLLKSYDHQISSLSVDDYSHRSALLTSKILAVEDNPIAQRMVKHLLESLGASVNTADNGEEAVAKIQANDYPLVIMDIGLPDQNGCDVAASIHQWQQSHRQKPSIKD
jgi:two-component system, OmpR family, aerobic respiration control sensor histidine kinase ArcB